MWDTLKEDSECPLCSLMKKAEEDALSYYSSSAIMTPEVRVETNHFGFCPHHSLLLAERGKPQSVALLMDTYYAENEKVFRSIFSDIQNAKKPKDIEKKVALFSSLSQEREGGCLVCTRMADRLYRYLYTLAALYKEDPSFKEAFLASKGLCMHHTLLASEVAKDALQGDDEVEYIKALFSLLEKNLKRVKDDDWWMTQKYKSENLNKPWNGCEDAQKRAVKKLIGEGRVIDPAKKKSKI